MDVPKWLQRGNNVQGSTFYQTGKGVEDAERKRKEEERKRREQERIAREQQRQRNEPRPADTLPKDRPPSDKRVKKDKKVLSDGNLKDVLYPKHLIDAVRKPFA